MTTPAVATSTYDDPSTVCEVIAKQMPAWTEIEDVLGGTRRLRELAAKYLPQHPGEKLKNYARRVARMRLFPAFKETLDGLTGMVFRSPPKLDPATAKELLQDAEDLDGMGNAFEVFARRLFWNGLARGWHGILVDMPTIANPERTSGLDERDRFVRPYWSMVHGSQVVNADPVTVNGRVRFRQLSVKYELRRRKGRFGEERYCIIREFLVLPNGRVGWITWEKDSDGKWAPTADKGLFTNCTQIPFVPFYSGRFIEPLYAEPGLEDLLHANLSHLRFDTNYETSLDVGMGPILWTRDRGSSEELEVGPFATIDVKGEHGAIGYAEPTGSSWAPAQERLKEYKAEMASLGLAMLMREVRQAETAEAKKMDKGEQNSKLAVSAIGLKDACEEAWRIHAEFRRKPAPSILLDLDFDQLEMPPEEIRIWAEVVASGRLSLQTFWQKLVDGRKLPDDFDPKVELQRLTDEAGALMAPAPDGDDDLDKPGVAA